MTGSSTVRLLLLLAALVVGCISEPPPAMTAGPEACHAIGSQAVYRSCELPEVVRTTDVESCLEVATDADPWSCELWGGDACDDAECAGDPECACYVVIVAGPYVVEGVL